MKKLMLLVAICFFLSAPILIAAQTTPPSPPKVLQIYREEIKQGKGAAHERVEASWVKVYRDANWQQGWIGMTSISGPTEAWFLSAYDSYAAWEKDRQNVEKNRTLQTSVERLDEQDGELRNSSRSILATYREDLSYRPGINLAQMRYFSVLTVRVRPGHNAEYEEARKILLEAFKEAKVDTPSAVYVITSGAPAGTYLVFTPRKSLAELDPNPDRTRAIDRALGEDKAKKRQKLLSDAVITTESNIFAFSPRMSYVTEEFARADPAFWNPKAIVTARRAPSAKTMAKPEKKTQ